MPVLVKLTFEVQDPARLLGNGGEALHGLILSILSAGDRILAHEIHRSPRELPFSVSGVRGRTHRQGEYLLLHPQTRYRFVAGFLEDSIGSLFLKTLSSRGTEGWYLGGVPLVFRDIQILAYRSYPELLQKAQSSSHRVHFRFLTPTSFRFQHFNVPFPLPQLVFQSLWTRWHRHAPDDLGEMPDFSQLRVRRFQLETRAVHFHQYLVVGALGETVYEIPEHLDPHRLKVHALTLFAPFAGVGYHTARGLGNVRTRIL